MKFIALYILLFVALTSSCTITRVPHYKQPIIIRTSEPSKLTVDGIEVKTTKKRQRVLLINSGDSLCIQAKSKKRNKDFCLKPIKPKIIRKRNEWMNTYPSFLYLDMEDTASAYFKYVTLNPNQKGKKNVLKLSPFKPMAAINPRVQISLERVWHQRLSTLLKLAPLLPRSIFDFRPNRFPNNKGIQLAIGQRLYFRPTAPMGTYISLEVEHLRSQYNDDWTFIDREDTMAVAYLDAFHVKKRTFSTSFLIGHQWLIQRFVIDLNVGIGARYKKVEHSNRENLSHSMMSPRHPNIYFEANTPGQYWTTNVPFNFSIGYLF